MDAMALLCTLHADGPATLKRLRQSGCDSIQAIAHIDADRLANLLDTTPAAARRFLREASHLAERVDAGFFEREERDAGERSQKAADENGAAREMPRTAAPSARERSTPLGYRDQRIVAQVLDAWRQHDADARGDIAAREASSAMEIAATDRSGPPGAETSHVDSNGTIGANAMERAASSDLVTGAVDGLDADTCQRLRAAGVESIEALAHADALSLSSALGIGYTRIARLCALARRMSRGANAPGSAWSAAVHGSQAASEARAQAPRGMPDSTDTSAEVDTKFSRAGTPSIGIMSALAEDLEVHSGPKPPLPSRTRWFPASATSDGDAGGPFA
jgi:hypothetical protein